MIIRVELYLVDGTYFFQNHDTVNVITDSKYFFNLVSIGSIEHSINQGYGWESGRVKIRINDTKKGFYRDMLASYERGAIEGSKVVITGNEEVLSGTWSLVEKHKWTGRIQNITRANVGAFDIQVSELFSELKENFPLNKITVGDYPNAITANIGKVIPYVFGNLRSTYGTVKAYNVDNNRYLLCDHLLSADNGIVTGVYWRNITIDVDRWAVLEDTDTERTYLNYTPPDDPDDSELPPDDVEFLQVNLETDKNNPENVIKYICDKVFGTDVFLVDNATLETYFTNNGWLFSGCFQDADSIGDILKEFCYNFFCFSYIDEDGMLIMGNWDDSSVESFGEDDIFENGFTETNHPERIENVVNIKYKFDFIESKFQEEDEYKHNTSVSRYKEFAKDRNLYFINDKDIAVDTTRYYVEQKKYPLRKAQMILNLSDIEGRVLGEMITVTHSMSIASGSSKYKIVKITKDLVSEIATVHLERWITEVDYIVTVGRNWNGGTITNLGINIVQSGDDLEILTVPDANISMLFYWQDWVKQVADNSINLINIVADIDILIVFKTDHFIITALTDGNGTIDPAGEVLVTSGNNQAFDFTPDGGKVFDYFVIDGATQTAVKPYTFTNVLADHTIKAMTTESYHETVTLTLTYDNTKGEIEPYERETVVKDYRSQVWLVFRPFAGNTVTLVEKDSVDVTAGNTTGIFLDRDDMEADIEIEVTFA